MSQAGPASYVSDPGWNALPRAVQASINSSFERGIVQFGFRPDGSRLGPIDPGTWPATVAGAAYESAHVDSTLRPDGGGDAFYVVNQQMSPLSARWPLLMSNMLSYDALESDTLPVNDAWTTVARLSQATGAMVTSDIMVAVPDYMTRTLRPSSIIVVPMGGANTSGFVYGIFSWDLIMSKFLPAMTGEEMVVVVSGPENSVTLALSAGSVSVVGWGDLHTPAGGLEEYRISKMLTLGQNFSVDVYPTEAFTVLFVDYQPLAFLMGTLGLLVYSVALAIHHGERSRRAGPAPGGAGWARNGPEAAPPPWPAIQGISCSRRPPRRGGAPAKRRRSSWGCRRGTACSAKRGEIATSTRRVRRGRGTLALAPAPRRRRRTPTVLCSAQQRRSESRSNSPPKNGAGWRRSMGMHAGLTTMGGGGTIPVLGLTDADRRRCLYDIPPIAQCGCPPACFGACLCYESATAA